MSLIADPARPSKYRYVILALLCFLAMITYMDRAANGSAKKAILSDLNKDAAIQESAATGQPVAEVKPKYDEDNDFFIVLMAFQLAYAIFEIPSGWLGDTVGPRSTLLRVVLWWSIFVALTGFTGQWLFGGVFFVGYWSLVIIQFLFGVGEAGAFPNIAKALYNWFPAADRGFAKSAVWMSARFMGGLTPFVWLLITDKQFGGWNWNEAMWLFAGLAVFWCVLFYFFFKNKPAEVKAVNAAELAKIDAGRKPPVSITKIPWKTIFLSRNLWAVCGMYVVTNFCWYFLMYNHPTSMKEQFKSWNGTPGGKIALALLSGAPLVVGMFGCLLGGLLSDRYIRKTGDRKWGRRLIGMVGYAGAGLCYLIAAGIIIDDKTNLIAYASMLILMGFMNDLIMAPAWAVCQDIGQEYAATVAGTMNMVGNLLGGVVGILVTGLILKSFPKIDNKEDPNAYVYLFGLYACVYFLGCGLWMLIDASKPIVAEPAKK